VKTDTKPESETINYFGEDEVPAKKQKKKKNQPNAPVDENINTDPLPEDEAVPVKKTKKKKKIDITNDSE
jgi:hypothetical protein